MKDSLQKVLYLKSGRMKDSLQKVLYHKSGRMKDSIQKVVVSFCPIFYEKLSVARYESHAYTEAAY